MLDPVVQGRNHDPQRTWDPMLDYAMMSRFNRGFASLLHATKPTVAKLHGFCVAGGTDIALFADQIIAAADTKIGYPPTRVWGVPAAGMWAHRLGDQRAKRLLFTGDSLYPGRLYVKDWAAYRASIRRLAAFVAEGNPVEWVLGAHIEMTGQSGRDYAMGADRHPDEHALQLRPGVLTELLQVLDAAGDVPARIVRDDFVVYPV